MYNYKETVKADVEQWVRENLGDFDSLEEPLDYDTIYDNCWIDDSVTGNASGSYTFSRWQARDNFFNDGESDDYINSMIEEGFISAKEVGDCVAESNWEKLDVCIRCYLLGEAVQEIVDEYC